MDVLSAAEWDENKILTWSGRWHIIDPRRKQPTDGDHAQAYCGAVGYLKHSTMLNSSHLVEISKGQQDAPTCKRCAAKADAG